MKKSIINFVVLFLSVCTISSLFISSCGKQPELNKNKNNHRPLRSFSLLCDNTVVFDKADNIYHDDSSGKWVIFVNDKFHYYQQFQGQICHYEYK